MVRRRAFTLIELIFAIVIIAISVVSLPMMNQAISKAIDSNLLQEAIFAAATELNEAISVHWDENSLEATSLDSLARVIDHSGNCENNASLPSYRQMPGHVSQPLHRRCLNSNAISPDDAAFTTDAVADINNMAHPSQNIFINPTPGQAGYKNTYNSAVAVIRPANFNGNNNDIKRIMITVTDDSVPAKTITTLKTYSCNIGEIDYYKKEY